MVELLDQEKEILQYTRTGIFERRKTQYSFLIFSLGFFGACMTLMLNNYASSKNENIFFILIFPICLTNIVHLLCIYQNIQIEKLDAERRKVLRENNHWQTMLGAFIVNFILLAPIIILLVLSCLSLFPTIQDEKLSVLYRAIVYTINASILAATISEIINFYNVKNIRNETVSINFKVKPLYVLLILLLLSAISMCKVSNGEKYNEVVSDNYENIIKKSSKDAFDHYKLGEHYSKVYRFSVASDHFYEAGILYLEKGEKDKALDALDRLKALNSNELERDLFSKLYPELKKER